MQIALRLIVGLAGGFVAGIVISEVIGITGVLLFDRMMGIKYLAVYTAVIGAGLGLLASRRAMRNSRESA